MEITIIEHDKIEIKSVKVAIICTDCGSSWAFYTKPDGSKPINWDVCISCAEDRAEATRLRIAGLDRGGK